MNIQIYNKILPFLQGIPHPQNDNVHIYQISDMCFPVRFEYNKIFLNTKLIRFVFRLLHCTPRIHYVLSNEYIVFVSRPHRRCFSVACMIASSIGDTVQRASRLYSECVMILFSLYYYSIQGALYFIWSALCLSAGCVRDRDPDGAYE